MNEQTKQSVDQTTSPERPESPKLESRVRNRSRDVAMTLLVVLPIGWAFEHLADRDTLEHLLKFQKHLYESVSNLNPLHLFGYLFDGFGFFPVACGQGTVLCFARWLRRIPYAASLHPVLRITGSASSRLPC